MCIRDSHQSAEQFVRESQRTSTPLYRVVGILDDDPVHRGRTLHGIPVYGAIKDFSLVIRKLSLKNERPQRVILGDDDLSGKKATELLSLCEEHGLSLARLPRLTDFRAGESTRIPVRPIAIEDVLGRSQTVQDKIGLQALVKDKVVLVTGAGGTIGGELARQAAQLGPKKLILLDASEYNLYRIDLELSETAPELPRAAVIGDVRDTALLDHLFANATPQIVFHAAAIKHVPIAEHNPEEAILTNVFGTINVAQAASRHGVQTMVLISTDKAVRPCNVMGATKRLAEQYVGAYAPTQKTHFVTVRFGNVLGSTGSVVPLFQRQLEAGGPLTVTHPDMTRYFMTVREAVELVMQAAALGQRPEQDNASLFVLDMGRPLRINDLAEHMIRLAGFKPHEDIQIAYTGLRPGEKMHEELFYDSEALSKTSLQGIMQAQIAAADEAAGGHQLASLLNACQKRETQTVISMLQNLVPDYQKTQKAA